MKRSLFCLLCLLVGSLGILQAQPYPELTKQKSEVLSKSLYSPTSRSTFISPFSQIQLSSNFGDESASARFGFSRGASTFAATLKQSFSSKPKQATLLKLDGLANNSTLELGYQLTSWHPKSDRDKLLKIRENFAIRNNISIDSVQKNFNLDDLQQDEIARREIMNDVKIDFGHPFILGIVYTVGRNDVDYITDNSSVNPLSRTTLNHTMRITAGVVLKSSALLAGSINFQNLFDLDDPIPYSFPAGTNGARFNKDVVVGTPTLTTRQQFKVEYRKSFLSVDGEPNYAISPSVSFVTKANKFAVEIPVYFLQSSKEGRFTGLQGGVSLAYASSILELVPINKGVGVSIFVAAPFQVFSVLAR